MSRAWHTDPIPSDTLHGQRRNIMRLLHFFFFFKSRDPFEDVLTALSRKMLIR